MQTNPSIIKGNLFASSAQTLVNTINTKGIMGAGIALEFKIRYPEMYRKYVELCKTEQIQIGKLWIYKSEDRWILNFPTKEDWKQDSKLEYLEKGLEKFVTTYKDKGITSAAFPILGASHGKIPHEQALSLMLDYLKNCDIPIEIYEYDPSSVDDIYPLINILFTNITFEEFVLKSKIQKRYAKIIFEAISDSEIRSLSNLINTEGLGEATVSKFYSFITHLKK